MPMATVFHSLAKAVGPSAAASDAPTTMAFMNLIVIDPLPLFRNACLRRSRRWRSKNLPFELSWHRLDRDGRPGARLALFQRHRYDCNIVDDILMSFSEEDRSR